MNREIARKVADAVLYEGYILYPYRPSAMKNRQRWSFGVLYPPDFIEVRNGTERSSMHSECLLETEDDARLQIQVRFLQLVSRDSLPSAERLPVPSGSVHGDYVFEVQDHGVERSVEIEMPSLTGEHRFAFEFPEAHSVKPARGGPLSGRTVDTQHHLTGTLSVSAQKICDGVVKLTIEATNTTPLPPDSNDRRSVLLRSLLSAHMIVAVFGGVFTSLLDPPKYLQEAARACRNIGNFPVLVGSDGERDMLLCSPILLYDYPQVAPESAGDFYDATEMDEMLTLRMLTLTEQERNEMRLADEHTPNLLERTERTAQQQLAKTHGAIRTIRAVGE
jgi:hypothetical protein